MALIQIRSLRKTTGGKYHRNRKKKKRDFGSDFIPVHMIEKKIKKIRTFGGGRKNRLLSCNVANVMDPETKRCEKLKIITVKENPANIHFVRMNILTKGSVIQTEKGLAKVTSRPGQDGTINAVLIKKQ